MAPPHPRPSRRFWEMAPDIVVEVVSPSDLTARIQRKVSEYLDAGCRLVWVVDPEARSVTVYRPRSSRRTLKGNDPLSGGDVLPDLQVSVADVLGGG